MPFLLLACPAVLPLALQENSRSWKIPLDAHLILLQRRVASTCTGWCFGCVKNCMKSNPVFPCKVLNGSFCLPCNAFHGQGEWLGDVRKQCPPDPIIIGCARKSSSKNLPAVHPLEDIQFYSRVSQNERAFFCRADCQHAFPCTRNITEPSRWFIMGDRYHDLTYCFL